MASRLRVGLVGAGAVAEKYHMPAIRAVPEVVPAIVVDADGSKAEAFATRHEIPRWARSHADLIGAADLAIVAVPNALHAPVSADLLGAGLHVLCEKPMARNTEECRAMIAAAEGAGRLLCIGHARRFVPHIALAHRLVERGYIGAITEVHAEEGDNSHWVMTKAYLDPELSGGGALIDVGIHAIDLIRWFAGEFQSLSYQGDGTETQVEKDARLEFTLAGGATGTVKASRTRRLAQKLTLKGEGGELEVGLWGSLLRIRGTRGKAFQKMDAVDIAWSRRSFNPSFVEQLSRFVSAIRGECEVAVDGHQGMAAVAVVRQAYDGAASGG